jgi:hypothetical protein
VWWFCPEGTFEFQGLCVFTCPEPYYHSIKWNSNNRCVLRCEEGAIVNSTTRVCTCGTPLHPLSCPAKALPAVLTCYCNSPNRYFNGFTCSSVCPPGYIGLSLAAKYTFGDPSSPPFLPPPPPPNPTHPPRFNHFKKPKSPHGTAKEGGACVKCPPNCLRCVFYVGKYSWTTLTCSECIEGYTKS